MRFLTLWVLVAVRTVFAGNYEQCLESIDSAGRFFSTSDNLSSYILKNDVFAVLGRISGIMEITLISNSPLRLDIFDFTTLGSESYCDIQVCSISLSAIVYVRDTSLIPDLRNIIEGKYFQGQVLPSVYCSELITSPGIEACCIYEKLQSKRSLRIDPDSLETKKMNTGNIKSTPSIFTGIPPEFSF